jgi:hypothetical protein
MKRISMRRVRLCQVSYHNNSKCNHFHERYYQDFALVIFQVLFPFFGEREREGERARERESETEREREREKAYMYAGS